MIVGEFEIRELWGKSGRLFDPKKLSSLTRERLIRAVMGGSIVEKPAKAGRTRKEDAWAEVPKPDHTHLRFSDISLLPATHWMSFN